MNLARDAALRLKCPVISCNHHENAGYHELKYTNTPAPQGAALVYHASSLFSIFDILNFGLLAGTHLLNYIGKLHLPFAAPVRGRFGCHIR